MKIVFKNSVVNALALVATLMSVGAPAYAELPESCRYSCSPLCMDELARLEAEIASFKNYNCYGNHPAPVPNPPPADDDDRVEIYNSDSCSGNLLAIVDSRTDCEHIGAGSAWGVKMNGKCYNIKDTTLTRACQAFKAGDRGGVKFYQSDSCKGNLIAIVNRSSDCRSYPQNMPQVWGVEIDGVCQNIDDMPFATACARFAH